MAKRYISEGLGIALIIGSLILVFLKQPIWAALLFIIWYFLFGFIGLANSCSRAKKIGLSNFFLAITCPYLLLPFRKCFYYWIKSQNLFTTSPHNAAKAYVLAKKVNTHALYTPGNKAAFTLYTAALNASLGYTQEARDSLNQMYQYPYTVKQDTAAKHLLELIEKTEPAKKKKKNQPSS